MASIILADQCPIVRFGLRSLLQNESTHRVVAEADDGNSALQLGRDLNPDILVLEPSLPRLSGLRTIRPLCRPSRNTRVVVLSERSDPLSVTDALENGASGYVLKNGSADEILTAVNNVASGGHYLSPPLAERMVQSHFRQPTMTGSDGYGRLTPRENEILRFCAEGKTAGQVAAELFISRRTVETHRANLMHKLRLHSQTELVKYACRVNLISI